MSIASSIPMSQMMAGMSLPIGSPGGIFVDPSASGRAELAETKSGISSVVDLLNNANPNATVVNPDGSVTQNKVLSTDALSNFDTLDSNISDHMTTKIGSLSTDLPIISAAKEVDMRVAASEGPTARNVAAPKDDCPDIFDKAFATIKNIGKFIGDIMKTVGDLFSSIGSALRPLFDAVGSVFGTVFHSMGDMMSAIGSASSSMLSAVTSAIRSAWGSISPIISSIGNVISSIGSAIGTAIGDFAHMIATEASVIAKALRDVLHFSFLSSTVSPNPCVKNIHDVVLNKDAIDPTVLQQATSVKIPTGDARTDYALNDQPNPPMTAEQKQEQYDLWNSTQYSLAEQRSSLLQQMNTQSDLMVQTKNEWVIANQAALTDPSLAPHEQEMRVNYSISVDGYNSMKIQLAAIDKDIASNNKLKNQLDAAV